MGSDLTKRVAVSIESARHKPGERASFAQANAAIDNIVAWLYDHGHQAAAEFIAEERERAA